MEQGPQATLTTVVALGVTEAQRKRTLETIAGDVAVPGTAEEALQAVCRRRPDLVVVAESVPRDAALAFVREVRRTAPESPVVVLAEERDVEEAIAFIRQGARDYLPARPEEEFVGRALAAARPPRGGRSRDRYFSPECPPGVPIVGQSEGIRRILMTLSQVARSQCNPAMIIGETGTGKELAARALHAMRGGGPENFVAVNCAALTANLLESELFGHVKGAFTGADRDKEGLFERAGTGSILLDEISEMPTNLQAKLLRVLQEHEFRRVGGTETFPCRATVIASSNRDLHTEAREGRFRLDLYYRLAVFPVRLPPLRAPERRDDLPLLADYFIKTSSLPTAGEVQGLSPEARDRLFAHNWPGNVRELRNVIERALITTECGGQIEPAALAIDTNEPPAEAHTTLPVPENDFSLETAERIFITRALRETGWQRTRAAALLGITRATLHAKLKRYQIRIPDRAGGSGGSKSKGAERPSRLQGAGV